MPGVPSRRLPGPSPNGRGLPVFRALLGGYVSVHVILRPALAPVVAIDDAREALLSQTLELDYLPRQPPLYNRLVWAAVRALGASTLVLTLCRYAPLALMYVFGYLAAVEVLGYRRLAALAAFSLPLAGPFNWDAPEELPHSPAAPGATAATFSARLHVPDGRGRCR